MPPPVEGSPNHYLTPEAAEAIARDIAEAGGTEVFFIGRRGRHGLVEEVEAHAYGNRTSVPAIIHHVKPGEVLIHNHPSGHLEPSDADIAITGHVGNRGVGSFIVNNDCTRVRVVVRPHDPKPKKRLDPERVESCLGPGSALAAELGEYEDRPEQRRMSHAVAEALNNDGISVIEAGTGTGKSLAYLVPAVLYALENDERVVVATHTINLQEQILHKDLPVVRRALEREFAAEIVKGRSNYVCKRKAAFARAELNQPQQSLIEDDFKSELRELLDWADQSETGDRQELPVTPRSEAWERIVSESDNCLRLRCKFYESCFFYNSRRRAARARVLIVNHSLLLSDIAVRRESNNWSSAAVLPPYKHVVLDEAHHLEEVATNHLGSQITRPAIRRLFGRLARTDGRARKGVLISLQEKLEELRRDGVVESEPALWKRLVVDLLPIVDATRDTVESMLDEFGHAFLELADIDRPRRGTEHRVRLIPEYTGAELWWNECEPYAAGIAREAGLFADANREALALVEELGEEAVKALLDIVMEWRSVIERLDGIRRLARLFLQEDEEMCRWVELSADRRDRLAVKLCQAPVSVARLLEENLHNRMKAEVLTSATLSVDGRFDFLFERTGIRRPSVAASSGAVVSGFAGEAGTPGVDEEEFGGDNDSTPRARPIESLLLGSSFDYREQVFLGVPEDLGDPRQPGFEDRLRDFVFRAVSVSGGRAFVLFTSWAQMKRLHERCAPHVERLGIECLVQGQENRDKLLRRFRDDETSVLFATSSFWEGVDVRGRALELLIIAKLPFAVPSDPIQEAQFEHLRAHGRDPFNALVVPRAVIRFKQGFGRLIRSRTDRGAVLIADERVTRMGYGKRFLRSLPDLDVTKGPGVEVLERMGDFLGNGVQSGGAPTLEDDLPF